MHVIPVQLNPLFAESAEDSSTDWAHQGLSHLRLANRSDSIVGLP